MNIQLPTYLAFKEYCKTECGDSFSVGIYQLLKTKDMFEHFIPLLGNLQQEISDLKVQLSQSDKRRVRTFGDE